jgi:hypothetical protein
MMVEIVEDFTGLPSEATFSPERGLRWRLKTVANFLPRAIGLIELETDGMVELFAEVQCHFTDGSVGEVTRILLSALEKFNWSTFDYKCALHPDCQGARKYLAAIIRNAIVSCTVIKENHLRRVGLHIVNGIPVFCTGDKLIIKQSQTESIDVVLETMPYSLDTDTVKYSEKDALTEMMKFVNLSPEIGNVLFAHSLLNVMRYLFIDIGITPTCIIFVVGRTGNKKTTYSAFATQIYNRGRGIEQPPRLNGTLAALESLLTEKADCSIVLDDLFPPDSKETQKNQEKVLEELVRIVGDNSGRARMKGNEVVRKQPECGVVVTGEYLVGTGSNAARIIPVYLTKPIDSVKLSECQREPLVISTFYYYFIDWYVSNYYEIRSLLEKWRDASRSNSLGVHSRLQESFFCLCSAYKLFLHYCHAKGFITDELANTQANSFQKSLVALLREQNKRVDTSNGGRKSIDYLKIIRDLYKAEKFQVSKNVKHFREKHDGTIHYDCLCLRGDRLLAKINELIPNANIRNITDSLKAQNALKRIDDKNSVQISALNGKRFYAIYLKKL